MDPVVATVGGFHDQLVKVGVMFQEVEPLLGELHVGVALVVIPIRVGIFKVMLIRTSKLIAFCDEMRANVTPLIVSSHPYTQTYHE